MQKIVVLDFGAQYAQLITRRIRECRVYSELVPHDISAKDLKKLKPSGIILSGGPASVYAGDALDCDHKIFDLGIPVLGICYGMQLIAKLMGGEVGLFDKGEYGFTRTDVNKKKKSIIFEDVPESFTSWMSHRDFVSRVPPGFLVTASTPDTPIAAFENQAAGIYGVQFHPEVSHTEHGMKMLKNFVFKACGIDIDWTPLSMIDEAVSRIKKQIGKADRAICALSGGVDSSVAALLVHRAIGDNLTCVFVDHGLLRKNEAEQVIRDFESHFHVNLIVVDARKKFLKKLEGVTDPEKKRKIIGNQFVRVFEAEAKKIKDAKYLVQGTLYPDVIESGTSKAAKIKTHHNVGGLPEDMEFELCEPLRNLFKDEVRTIGRELGLGENVIGRHPFPGPGLAVRIIGDVDEQKLEILREADAIFIEELHIAGLYDQVWQAFAVLPDIKTVGVQGDSRTYAYPIILRAVTSEDAMTADWAKLPHKFLQKVSNRIINEVTGVNRVAYDISSKPPATIEWE